MIRNAYYRWYRRIGEVAYAARATPELRAPIVLLGCGRSGKSTLAAMLARDDRVVFLDEPRRLWQSAFPQADIWSRKSRSRGGRIVLDAHDYEPRRAARLRRLYQYQCLSRGGSFLVDELAINNFRIGLIRRVFPDARFIHVYRYGLEVAELIGKAAAHGRWFGADQYKWHQLVSHAEGDPATRGLAARCKTARDKGLLEWRTSTEAVVASLADLPRERYMELNSAELFECPAAVSSRVAEFIGTKDALNDKATAPQAASPVRRRVESTPTEHDAELGGPLLQASGQRLDGLVARGSLCGPMRESF